MSKFNYYFLMKEEDVEEYVREKLELFRSDKELMVKEIGDGNLNYVFHVANKTGSSVIIKQAGVTLRISAEMKISTDRNRIEAEILELQNKYAPGLVPKLYFYDTVMCAYAMEDLSDYELMRHALMKHKTFPQFAQDITTYMVNTLLGTTDVVMEHKRKKELVKSFINPELCGITEDLVLTEPYHDIKSRNIVFPKNEEFINEELYNDEVLHLEIAKLKFGFMNNAQALIHGDLHTGSIFVKEDSTRIFDPEFAYYGPIGYDIGNMIANLFFAWNNGNAAGNETFCDWIITTVSEIVDLFKEKFIRCYDANVTDIMAKTKGFKEYYLSSILADTAGYAGTELIRRTVGMAQVKDITSITDEEKRAYAERVNIRCAKDLIMNRVKFHTGSNFAEALLQVTKMEKVQKWSAVEK